MKVPNDGGKLLSLCWILALNDSLLFGLVCSQASVPSLHNIKLFLCGGKWTTSERYYQILRKKSLKKTLGTLVISEEEAKDAWRLETKDSDRRTENWIAFFAMWHFSFKDKMKVAIGKGTTGVIIFKPLGPYRQYFIVTQGNRDDIAAIQIGHLKGKQDVQLIQKLIRVIAVTKVRHEQSFWKNCLFYALILQCFGYILFVIAERYDKPRTQISKTQLWQAVHSLELHKLKKSEFDLAEETCVVCLETYKPREVVRFLTCRHIFHKQCIVVCFLGSLAMFQKRSLLTFRPHPCQASSEVEMY